MHSLFSVTSFPVVHSAGLLSNGETELVAVHNCCQWLPRCPPGDHVFQQMQGRRYHLRDPCAKCSFSIAGGKEICHNTIKIKKYVYSVDSVTVAKFSSFKLVEGE